MRRLVVTVVLLAGCASTSEYVAGPATTVREPNFSGPINAPATARTGRQFYPQHDPLEPPAAALPDSCEGSWARRWLFGGPGLTWGRASRLPFRDEGLDRRMVDMLSGGNANTPLESDLYVLCRLPQEEPRTADRPDVPKLAASPSYVEGTDSWTFPLAPSKGEVPHSCRSEPSDSTNRQYHRSSDTSDVSSTSRDARTPEANAPARRTMRSRNEEPASRDEWQRTAREDSDLP